MANTVKQPGHDGFHLGGLIFAGAALPNVSSTLLKICEHLAKAVEPRLKIKSMISEAAIKFSNIDVEALKYFPPGPT
ncbi:hypothetical protein SC1_00767 [Sphingopyxis sp. C-1]|nr:hypothetical protein SC1_00767 [Sphingopyxis sp. C-1]